MDTKSCACENGAEYREGGGEAAQPVSRSRSVRTRRARDDFLVRYRIHCGGRLCPITEGVGMLNARSIIAAALVTGAMMLSATARAQLLGGPQGQRNGTMPLQQLEQAGPGSLKN